MSQKEIESRLGRLVGQTPSAREYVEAETKDLEWYAFDRRDKTNVIKGTKKELLSRGR